MFEPLYSLHQTTFPLLSAFKINPLELLSIPEPAHFPPMTILPSESAATPRALLNVRPEAGDLYVFVQIGFPAGSTL